MLRILLKTASITFAVFGTLTLAGVMHFAPPGGLLASHSPGDSAPNSAARLESDAHDCCASRQCTCILTAYGMRMYLVYAAFLCAVALASSYFGHTVEESERATAAADAADAAEASRIAAANLKGGARRAGYSALASASASSNAAPVTTVPNFVMPPSSIRQSVLLGVCTVTAVLYRFFRLTLDRAGDITHGPDSDLVIVYVVIWQSLVILNAALQATAYAVWWLYTWLRPAKLTTSAAAVVFDAAPPAALDTKVHPSAEVDAPAASAGKSAPAAAPATKPSAAAVDVAAADAASAAGAGPVKRKTKSKKAQ